MAVRILPRSAWTSTSARGTPINWSRVRGLVCHYPATSHVGVVSQDAEAARLRGWRSYHVHTLGWQDVGYSYAIAQSGRIYKLRGDRVGAHTYGHNSTTLGVLFIVGTDEPLTNAARASFRALRATLRHRGASSGVWGHREMSGNSTRCPGPHIMADIRSGALTGASAPSRPSTPGLSDGLADVDDSQRWLTELGYAPGPVDGIFGPRTEAATKRFQSDFDITPVDGRPGPATRAILEDAMTKLDDIARKIDRLPAKILDEPIKLAGMHEGQTSTLRTKAAYEAHNFTQIHQMLAAAEAAILEAVQESGKAQGLTNDQVKAIATAAAEAAARVSAEDVAGQLEVAVRDEG